MRRGGVPGLLIQLGLAVPLLDIFFFLLLLFCWVHSELGTIDTCDWYTYGVKKTCMMGKLAEFTGCIYSVSMGVKTTHLLATRHQQYMSYPLLLHHPTSRKTEYNKLWYANFLSIYICIFKFNFILII